MYVAEADVIFILNTYFLLLSKTDKLIIKYAVTNLTVKSFEKKEKKNVENLVDL